MSDDIVVVDNGSTYETQESAIVAKNEADRAEQWAKYSEEKANLADERAVDAAESSDAAAQAATAAIEAKQYAETAITDENLIVVATDLKSTPSNIKKTAESIDNINTVFNDIENINAVAANKANIDKVAADTDNIDTVTTNILNVNTVAKNIDNVNLLAPHTEAMEALAPDIMDVVTVAGITEQTKNVSDNMSAVVDVSNNKTNINNVSVNMPAVTDVSKNMADVKKAVQSANDAKLWAVGTITEKPEGSSKYWAEQAKQTAQVYDATETVKGIVRLATSNEVTAGTNDSTAITPLKLKQKIAQDLTSPSANTVPSTKAVSDESSRLESIMSNKIGEITSFWETSLNSKANVTLDNVSPAQSFKETVVGWSIPDYSAGVAISSGYVAQTNGFVVYLGAGSGEDIWVNLFINGKKICQTSILAPYNQKAYASAFVGKGDIVTIEANKLESFVFYPLKGVN